ncbi:MAG: phosphopantothenate/pantothenate synthetase family protein, partial [Thermoplasmata archaeon]|nr:phosphopantothenate/pantothenate synthetase family protein [Thermoplasmata archaeon]
IDLNPLSRTSLVADLPIVDELRRALTEIGAALGSSGAGVQPGNFPRFDRRRALQDARGAMVRGLTAALARRPGRSRR